MATIDNTGNLAYIYDEDSDTWYAMAGTANATLPYVWSASHTFENSVSFESVLTSQAGINNFATVAARDTVISSPSNGVVCFIQNLNQLQYYSNGWRFVGDDVKLSTKSATHTLELADGGKTILVNSNIGTIIYVPTNTTVPFPVGQVVKIVQIGSGSVNVIAESGSVSVRSRDSINRLAGRYSESKIVKIAENEWVLSGDLNFSENIDVTFDPDFDQIVSAPNYDIDVTNESSGTSIVVNFAGGTGLVRKTVIGNSTFSGQNYRPGSIKTVLLINGTGTKTLTFPTDWTFLGQKPVSIDGDRVGVLSVTSFGDSASEVVASWIVEV